MNNLFKVAAVLVFTLVSFTAQAADVVKTKSEIQGQCKPLTLQQVTDIQTSLTGRGFYKGDINGIWNKETLEAVQAYQTSRELAPTGELTTTDLEALGLDVTGLRQEYVTTEKVDIRKHGNGPNARGKQSFLE